MEGPGDPQDVDQADVHFAPLDRAHEGPMDPRLEPETLLRETAPLAVVSHAGAELDERGAGHAPTVALRCLGIYTVYIAGPSCDLRARREERWTG